jgi:hypothetical protein
MYLLCKVSLVDNLLKHVDEIVELAVNIAYDDHGLSESDDVWFFLFKQNTTIIKGLEITY